MKLCNVKIKQHGWFYVDTSLYGRKQDIYITYTIYLYIYTYIYIYIYACTN